MKQLLNYEFEYVQDLNPVLNSQGEIKIFYPQRNYKNKDQIKLNKYGEGAFCKFSIHPKWSGVSGVYTLFIDGTLSYIGQALDLTKRYNQGYGNISPRNCYVGGQSTNCKINQLVLNSTKNNKTISLYIHLTHNIHEIERELIMYYKPPFNSTLNYNLELPKNNYKSDEVKASEQKNLIKKTNNSKNPPISMVRKYIEEEIKIAKQNGNKDIIISSGVIHKKLNMFNAMPTVCNAMKTLNGNYKYEVIEEPPKGNGSRLTFRYLIL